MWRKQGRLDGSSSLRACLWFEGRKGEVIVHSITVMSSLVLPHHMQRFQDLFHESGETLCDHENKVHLFENTMPIA